MKQEIQVLLPFPTIKHPPSTSGPAAKWLMTVALRYSTGTFEIESQVPLEIAPFGCLFGTVHFKHLSLASSFPAQGT